MMDEKNYEQMFKTIEFMTRLELKTEQLHKSQGDLRDELKTHNATMAAMLDNIYRAIEQIKAQNDREEGLLKLFEQERLERKAVSDEGQKAISDLHKETRDLVQSLISEELNKNQQQRDAAKMKREWISHTAKAVWEKGGAAIIAALCLLLVLKINSCSGLLKVQPAEVQKVVQTVVAP